MKAVNDFPRYPMREKEGIEKRRGQLMDASVNNLVQQLVEGNEHWFIALGGFLPLVLGDRMFNHGHTVHVAEPLLAPLNWLFKQWWYLSNARRD